MPDLANEHIDVALTNLSLAYTNEMYVADDVFPIVPVPKRSDKYFLYNKDTYLRSSGVDAQGKPNSIRRPGTRSTESSYDLSPNPFYAEQLARNMPVPDADVAISDQPLQPAMDATLSLTETLHLDNEIAVAAKVMKRANYPAANKVQLVTGTTSWAAATGKPMSVDIPNGKKAVILGIIRAPTHILMDYSVAVTLSQQAEYIDRIKYVSREGMTAGGLVPVIEGLTVVEARPQKATSAEGVAAITTGYVWLDDQGQDAALIYYRPPGQPNLRSVSFGLTFDAPDDTLGTHDYATKRWREEAIDSERVECRITRDWRFTCTDGSTNGDNANGLATGAYLISGTLL